MQAVINIKLVSHAADAFVYSTEGTKAFSCCRSVGFEIEGCAKTDQVSVSACRFVSYITSHGLFNPHPFYCSIDVYGVLMNEKLNK